MYKLVLYLDRSLSVILSGATGAVVDNGSSVILSFIRFYFIILKIKKSDFFIIILKKEYFTT